MKRITGTHVYTWLKCPRVVALDLHGDTARRRPHTEAEEQLLRRGREHEERIVAGLGYARPQYEPRDFLAGAAATSELLAAGVSGVLQGVLLQEHRLGIPDLLRREPGESRLGPWHYVVGDVKSSRRARSDQLLQVAFYSRLVAESQGRAPEYCYLLLKDGREERFALAEFAEAIQEVEAGAGAMLDAGAAARERPFLSRACSSCRWSSLCEPEMQERDDLALLQRMTRGLRTVLESAGVATCAAAAAMSVESLARRTHLEAPLLRRIKRAAEARRLGDILHEPRGRRTPVDPAALVHLVSDPFHERVLFFGVLCPAHEGAPLRIAVPRSREAELDAFLEVVRDVPDGYSFAHFGSALPRWSVETSHGGDGLRELERRFVDLAPRFRGAAVFPGPIFGFEDQIRLTLGREPFRAGATFEPGSEELAEKGRNDLLDLARLKSRLLEDGPVA